MERQQCPAPKPIARVTYVSGTVIQCENIILQPGVKNNPQLVTSTEFKCPNIPVFIPARLQAQVPGNYRYFSNERLKKTTPNFNILLSSLPIKERALNPSNKLYNTTTEFQQTLNETSVFDFVEYKVQQLGYKSILWFIFYWLSGWGLIVWLIGYRWVRITLIAIPIIGVIVTFIYLQTHGRFENYKRNHHSTPTNPSQNTTSAATLNRSHNIAKQNAKAEEIVLY